MRMIERVEVLGREHLVRAVRASSGLVAVASSLGRGYVLREGRIVEEISVDIPLLSTDISNKVSFGGLGKVIIINDGKRTLRVGGTALYVRKGKYASVYYGGSSKVYDLEKNEVIIEIKDVIRSIDYNDRYLVLVGANATRIYSEGELLFEITLEKGRGVVLSENEMKLLVRDPYFIDVSHVYDYTLGNNIELKRKVSLEGTAYDLHSDNETIAIATSDYVYLLDNDLNEIKRIREGAISASVDNDLVCYASKGALRCGIFK
ncbi:hypothetical protein IPA_05575 [Ignicoccus pacificus DSM 13166]|uniref:Uncharacterized protein n=1 Tax=Ignicoccus pacificus DSM 13166 TaxID=940294 RepID=A0A977PKZ8_9CREN|nr:hypothetical protein IPA_05575 [Ignicoccus pacificus DSM 13166]